MIFVFRDVLSHAGQLKDTWRRHAAGEEAGQCQGGVCGTHAGVMAMAENWAVLGRSWVGPKWRKTLIV